MTIYYAKFKFVLKTNSYVKIDAFFENILRGGIGYELHRLCCEKRIDSCKDCNLMKTCLYSYLYNTPAPDNSEKLSKYLTLPHPYIIYFPRQKLIFEAGEEIHFYLTLFGRALNYLGYYIHALKSALIYSNKLKHLNLTLSKVEVIYDDNYVKLCFKAEDPLLNFFTPNFLELKKALDMLETNNNEISKIKINFNSAFRVKEDNKLTDEIKFSTIIKSILKRFSNIAYFHCNNETNIDFKGIIQKSENANMIESNLSWFEFDRFSVVQKAKMKLGGVVGNIIFECNKNWLELLKIGEIIHIGKNTSFGLGNYKVEVID